MFAHLIAAVPALATTFAPLLAEGSKLKSSLAWALVLLLVVLGMLVTLQPVKREKEVKGRRE